MIKRTLEELNFLQGTLVGIYGNWFISYLDKLFNELELFSLSLEWFGWFIAISSFLLFFIYRNRDVHIILISWGLHEVGVFISLLPNMFSLSNMGIKTIYLY